VNHTPDTSQAFSGDGGPLDPRQAAALLEQATRQARREFTPGTPALFVFRAVVALIAFGGLWLSVRGQVPYTGPSGWAIAVAFALVAINTGWSAWAIKRAGSGVSGPASRATRAWLGVMLVAWVAGYAVIAPLYHAGAGHPAWGLYPANAPLLILGLVCGAVAAARHHWPMAAGCLAIAVAAAAAGFGGPAGAWLIAGIGLCAVCLGTAAITAWDQRRGVVRP
jgi:hypothetical protein